MQIRSWAPPCKSAPMATTSLAGFSLFRTLVAISARPSAKRMRLGWASKETVRPATSVTLRAGVWPLDAFSWAPPAQAPRPNVRAIVAMAPRVLVTFMMVAGLPVGGVQRQYKAGLRLALPKPRCKHDAAHPRSPQRQRFTPSMTTRSVDHRDRADSRGTAEHQDQKPAAESSGPLPHR